MLTLSETVPLGSFRRWRILELVLATGAGKGPPTSLIALWSLGPRQESDLRFPHHSWRCQAWLWNWTPHVLPWRGPLGTNPSGRGSFRNSGQEPRRRHTEESATCETRGGAGNTRMVDGSAYKIGSHYPPGRIWRAGDGGGSNMHERGLSSPIDSEVYNEMRWMSSSTSRMASPAVRTLIGRGAGVIPSNKHMLFVARCLVETQAALSFGGPYALIRWSSEGMKSAVCGHVMPRRGVCGSAGGQRFGGLGSRGRRNLALPLVNGLSATPDRPPFPSTRLGRGAS